MTVRCTTREWMTQENRLTIQFNSLIQATNMIPYLADKVSTKIPLTGRYITQRWFLLTAAVSIITLALLGKTINVYIDNYTSTPRKMTHNPINNTEYGTRPLFPLIIHQTYKSYKVPKEFTDWVRSWHRYNPEWEYWFWSRAEIDALVDAKYPHFKDMFDHYDQGIRRADAVRYMILHEIGGFYADLDMECLQPLNVLAERFNCFLSEENYEHVNLIYHRRDPIMINCVMGCRAGHPFYKDLVDRIPAQRATKDVIQGMGPLFFTSVYEAFQKKENISISDHIALLPPRYLLPVRDQITMLITYKGQIHNTVQARTKSGDSTNDVPPFVFRPSLDKEQILREAEISQAVNNMNFTVPKHPEALTTHHWVHSWDPMKKKFWGKKPKVHIKKLVTSIKLYSNILNGKQTSMYYDIS